MQTPTTGEWEAAGSCRARWVPAGLSTPGAGCLTWVPGGLGLLASELLSIGTAVAAPRRHGDVAWGGTGLFCWWHRAVLPFRARAIVAAVSSSGLHCSLFRLGFGLPLLRAALLCGGLPTPALQHEGHQLTAQEWAQAWDSSPGD